MQYSTKPHLVDKNEPLFGVYSRSGNIRSRISYFC